ncbi:MAG: hypothetical protein K0U84_13520 [Actinomycetia bacterium]|nr:hypothetical protein [Actinomycetes bacterium]
MCNESGRQFDHGTLSEAAKAAILHELGSLMQHFSDLSLTDEREAATSCERKECMAAAVHRQWSDHWMKAAQIIEKRIRVVEAKVTDERDGR